MSVADRASIEREVRDTEPGCNMTDYEVSVIVDLIIRHAREAEERLEEVQRLLKKARVNG